MPENKIRLDLKIYTYDGEMYIKVMESDRERFKFIYDPEVKRIHNIKIQKRASEEAIREYYQRISKEEYTPLNFNQATSEINRLSNSKAKVISKREKVFKNGNRIIFTNKRNIQNFDFTYITVRVKVYFDGHYVISRGRSDYRYFRDIKDDEIPYYISQAVMRAIAPYGSNLNFKPLSWSFAYHQTV